MEKSTELKLEMISKDEQDHFEVNKTKSGTVTPDIMGVEANPQFWNFPISYDMRQLIYYSQLPYIQQYSTYQRLSYFGYCTCDDEMTSRMDPLNNPYGSYNLATSMGYLPYVGVNLSNPPFNLNPYNEII